MGARGVFGRADLLHALWLRPALEVLGAATAVDMQPLVYRRKAVAMPALAMPPGVRSEPPRTTLRPPLQMPCGWQAERVPHTPDTARDHDEDGAIGPAVPPLVRATEDEEHTLQDQVDAPPPPHRTRAVLRAALGEAPTGSGRIDWPSVVRHLAQGRRVQRWPRVAPPAWPGHLHVVLDDQAESMRSLAWDMAVWRRRLAQVMGDSRLVVHRLGRTLEALARPGAPGFDTVGHRWLILSDGRVTEPVQRRQFNAWVQGLRHRQHTVVMRAPMPVGAFDVAGVNDVLALLAMLGQVSTLLLRGLCQCVPGAAAGLEWAVWNHPQVRRAGHHVELQPEHLDEYIRHLRTLPPERLRQALRLQRVFQRSLPEADLHLVLLRVARLAPRLEGELADEVHAARQFFMDMGREGGRLQGQARLDWALRAARLAGKTPDVVRWAEAATFQPLGAQVRRWRERGEVGPWWLKLDAEGVRLDRTPDLPGALLLPEEVMAPLQAGGVVGPAPQGDKVLEIELASGTVRITRRERPAWAESFVQGPRGLRAVMRCLDGSPLELPLDMRPFVVSRDEYGPKLALPLGKVAGTQVVANFRYMPSGTFLMGAPEGIGHADEHPQHQVTLTEEFWLADTPCTQAQWQAVMHDNPAYFKVGPDAPRRPVEQVSWDDVQQFLPQLQMLLPPGIEAVLPTEAQWEYAARAGTHATYWWGDEQHDRMANWAGRQNGTTPVDRYLPNPWGLHDMHGNVWEWCADGPRTYGDRAECDPLGNTEASARVVRGGSWIDAPGDARAAYHFWWPRFLRSMSRGFRVLLRHSIIESNP